MNSTLLHAPALVLLAWVSLVPFCEGKQQARIPVEVTVTRYQLGLRGEVVVQATAHVLDAIGDYEEIADRVIQIGYEKGVVAPTEFAIELPLVIDGTSWTTEYWAERGGRYLGRVVGKGEIHPRSVSGEYKFHQARDGGWETLHHTATFVTVE